MLRWRLILGALFIAEFVLICWLDAVVTAPGTFLLPLALIASWMGVRELLWMFANRGRRPLPWVLHAGVVLCVLSAAVPGIWTTSPLTGTGWMAVAMFFGVGMSLVGELQRFDGRWQTTVNLGLSAFGIVYLGGSTGFLVQLRLLEAVPVSNRPAWGMLALISLIATVKMSDTGQYAIGRLIGRHKLAPVISPGKTWEGAVAGLIAAGLTAWFVLTWGARHFIGPSAPAPNDWVAIIYGVILGLAGILGDLAESVLKRDAQVKDSSTWLAGFGGVLDLIDSLLVAAPVAYLFWVLRIVGP